MTDTVKIPYGHGVEDAIALEVPGDQPPPMGVNLSDGNRIKVELRVMNIFRLLNKQDENGEPIYVLSVQLKTTTVAKNNSDAVIAPIA